MNDNNENELLYCIIANGKNVYMDGLTLEEAENAQWELYRMYPEHSYSVCVSDRKRN